MTSTDRATGAPGARDVERLFGGDFGRDYTARNETVDPRKPQFFHALFRRHGIRRVLECGCNLGLNLSATIDANDANDATNGTNSDQGGAADAGNPGAAIDVWGIDIQRGAIERAWAERGGGNFVVGSIFELPFRDAWFDLAFTCGVLIHVPAAGLGDAMAEMVRVSRRFVLSAEYHDDADEVAVPWRGQDAALWRRNYKKHWLTRFPDLRLVEEGYEGPERGFDRITWHLFEKAR